MTTPNWKDKHRGNADFWSLEDFQQVAARELARLGIERPSPNAPPFELKERLVRYYTSEGAVDRPERDGKEARYGYIHLIQLLVTRVLINDGWPLSKIAAFIRSNDLSSLEAMLPDRPPTQAEEEIDNIKRAMHKPATGLSDRMVFSQRKAMPPPKAQPQISAPDRMLSLQSDMSKGRSLLSNALKALGTRGSSSPQWKEAMEIELTPWCRVIVDLEELSKAPPHASELVGEALVQALRERRAQGRERK